MAEFATLDGNQQNIPYAHSGAADDALGLTNPDSVLSGTSRGVQNLGSPQVYSDGGNNQIIVADTVPRVLMGNQKTFGEGFYVSKAGVNAATNTDATQWIFNSNQNVFKIVLTGTTTLTIPNTMTAQQILTVSVPHNLGIQPAFQVYGIVPSAYGSPNAGQLTNLPILVGLGNGVVTLFSQASADTTNLNISVINNYTVSTTGVAGTWTFRYYIYQETAAAT